VFFVYRSQFPEEYKEGGEEKGIAIWRPIDPLENSGIRAGGRDWD
jgi:hypothetical protein